MHPLIDDIHRPDAIVVRPISTGATAVGRARHLREMATVRTRLGRVRLSNFHERDILPTKLLFQAVFQPSELQCPHFLVVGPRDRRCRLLRFSVLIGAVACPWAGPGLCATSLVLELG